MIRETVFIDKHVRCIETDQSLITPRKGRTVSVLASFSKETIFTVDIDDEKRTNEAVCKVEKMTILSLFDASNSVVKNAEKTYAPGLYRTDRTITTQLNAKDIAEIIPSGPFYIKWSPICGIHR